MNFLFCSISILFGLCPLYINGQVLKDTIPISTNAIEGQLQNGLRYIIHPATSPNKKTEYRLVMKVGSICETDSQKGYSHFLEHMLFNGTVDFPNRSLIEQLQAKGMRYGVDFNAYTSYDKTVYILSMPEQESMDLPLTILENWLHKAHITEMDTEKEKRIVIQEIRDFKNEDVFFASKLQGTMHAKRLPIAGEQDIKNITSKDLQGYYKQWYRPDLATVIVTGAIDPELLENNIIKMFKPLALSSTLTVDIPKFRPDISGKIYVDTNDKLQENILDLTFFIPVLPRKTMSDYKNELTEQLFKMIINSRLEFYESSSGIRYNYDYYLADIYNSGFEIRFKTQEQILRQMAHLSAVLQELTKQGISTEELAYTKARLMQKMKLSQFEEDAVSLAESYVDQAVYGDRYINPSNKKIWASELLDHTSIDDVQKKAARYLEVKPLWLFQQLVDSDTLKQSIIDLENAYKKLPVPLKKFEFIEPLQLAQQGCIAFQEFDSLNVPRTFLVPEGGNDKRVYKNLNVTTFRLPNGIQVVLKAMPTADSTLQLTLFGKGGLSTFSPEQYPYYQNMGAYLDWGELNGMDEETILELCVAKQLSVLTNIETFYHEISVKSFRGGLTDMLKMIYLKLIEPTVPHRAFNQYKAQVNAAVDNSDSQWNNMPYLKLQKVIEDYKAKKPAVIERSEREILEVMSIDTVFAKFKNLFKQTDGLVAVLTGNFDVNQATSEMVSYLGALPTSDKKQQYYDFKAKRKLGVVRKVVSGADTDRLYTNCLIKGRFKPGLKKSMQLYMLRAWLELKFTEYSREQKGMVYSPFVELDFTIYPDSWVYYNFVFSSSKNDGSDLEKTVLDLIKSVQSNLLKHSELEMLKNGITLQKSQFLNENNTDLWHAKLIDLYLNFDGLSSYENFDELLFEITAEDMLKTALEVLDTDNYGIFHLKNNNLK
ncbi:M16 family metallopeptidase [Flavobacterium sp. NKUCC04_CG]|uniref:M16 family metallopeptidase n=1 Tax=Flavobacterium sp. NKUCC04_CG TaxID=2842121 RepID=UPI001C5A8103|nr:M16 family metallopeptidase [Flavobacterium sp. NKUCC04_CG]MBW3519812.1 insulinase family protein [Flavobacterium sp. NKUCC04_CG]